MEATLRQEKSLGKEEAKQDAERKPFAGTLWVLNPHPVEFGQQPEASLACTWGDPEHEA